MADIIIVRQQAAPIAPADAEAARRVLFGIVDGLGERGRKQWRRLVNGLMRMEPGEMLTLKTHKARSGPFHRRHMLIEQRVFESQERIAAFEDFRLYLKVGSGHVNWMAGPRGGVVPVPKSIGYSAMEDGEMREFHDNVIAFLRTEHAAKYLWPHSKVGAEQIELLLAEFDE